MTDDATRSHTADHCTEHRSGVHIPWAQAPTVCSNCGARLEPPRATPDRAAEVVAETLWLIDAAALHGEPGYKAKALSECSPRVRAGFALRAAAVLSALRNAGLKVTDA